MDIRTRQNRTPLACTKVVVINSNDEEGNRFLSFYGCHQFGDAGQVGAADDCGRLLHVRGLCLLAGYRALDFAGGGRQRRRREQRLQRPTGELELVWSTGRLDSPPRSQVSFQERPDPLSRCPLRLVLERLSELKTDQYRSFSCSHLQLKKVESIFFSSY